MAERDDRYSSHQLWQRLDTIKATLSSAQELATDSGVEATEHWHRLETVIRHVRSVLDSTDPHLVAIRTLDELNNHLGSVENAISSFNSHQDVAHLADASSRVDNALLSVSALTHISSSDAVANVREDIASFRKSVGQYLRNVEGEADRVLDDVQQVQRQAAELASQIDSQRTRLDQAIGQFQQQSANAIEHFRTASSELITASQKEFNDDQAARLEWKNTDNSYKLGEENWIKRRRTQTSNCPWHLIMYGKRLVTKPNNLIMMQTLCSPV